MEDFSDRSADEEMKAQGKDDTYSSSEEDEAAHEAKQEEARKKHQLALAKALAKKEEK